MRQILFITLLCIGFLGCNNDQMSCGEAYFGGEIINPNSDYLVLYDDVAPIDTIYLDENNRFSRKLENLNSGLHSFIHGGEYQIMILEPTDSILLRLNTLDFDESIVFTGKGSKKNNYLINLFVTIEKQEKAMYGLSKLNPKEFQNKLDSLRSVMVNDLANFLEKYPESELFRKMANASIDFSYYARKELYPFRHYGVYDKIDYKDFPEDFYAFRRELNYNDEDLMNFYPYYNFLFHHINNLALDLFSETSNSKRFDRNSIDYNLTKLHLIDSLVMDNTIKNNLLKYTTRNFLSYCNSVEESEAMCASYFSKSTDEEHSEYIKKLNSSLKKLHPGNKFPEIEIINFRGEAININSIFDRPTVVYFWSKAVKNHFKNSHKRVKYLREEYPGINFVSININSNYQNMWKKLVKQNNFDIENEYKFRNPDAAKKILALHYINKVMVVNNDKEIVTSNANIFDKEFKDILDKLE